MAKSTPTKAKAKAKPSTSASASSARPKVTVRTVSSSRTRPDLRTLFSRRLPLNRELRLGALFAELAGTFALTAAVLYTSGNVIIAALTVLVMTAAFYRLSGGHVNTAVTVSLWASRRISGLRAIGFIVAQLLGAMLAVVVVTQFINSAQVDPLSGQVPHIYTVDKLVGQWRPFLAEMLGAVVLGFGVAASRLGRRTDLEIGWLIGGALLVGLIIASQGSSALLNPAVALGVSAYDFNNWWTVWAYALAPVFGASVGVWLYKGMQWELKVRDEE
jgi:aquaporin Z